MRLDLYLVNSGLAPTRQKAVYLIKEGLVKVSGKVTNKPSADVENKTVELLGEGLKYVGRGGLKLEGAIRGFDLDVKELVCLDLGASTGGFTDCLLSFGAQKVYALDVGSGQLHEKLRNDRRVVVMENFNARDMKRENFDILPTLAVSDLSFISQKLIYKPVSDILDAGNIFVSLIKPQFEAGRNAIGKNGIVKDEREHVRVIRECRNEAEEYSLILKKVLPSPIKGGDGNREYLGLFIKNGSSSVSETEILSAVYGNTGNDNKENVK